MKEYQTTKDGLTTLKLNTEAKIDDLTNQITDLTTRINLA